MRLPAGFTTIRDILDEAIRPGSLVNIVGLVKDWRLPVATRGTDYKTALTLYDLSTQQQDDSVNLHIFRSKEDMPEVKGADVVMVFQVKVQNYYGRPSLISSFPTCVHIFSSSKIPKPPKSARVALNPPTRKGKGREPSDRECEYASYFFHEVDKYCVPDEGEFQTITLRSLSIKEKFGLLQDACDGRFYDLVVQVVREPYDLGDKITLYVSDYTQNESFFNYTWEGVKDLGFGESEPWEGASPSQTTTKEWVGPYGKKALQITCFEPHATYIRSQVKAGSWVSLRNVQVKFGRNGCNLEGFLREDRDAGKRFNVQLMDTSDPNNVDPRLKDALRRCRDYLKQKKADLKRLQAAESRPKRKLNSEKKTMNSKVKRKKLREAREERAEGKGMEEDELLGLNKLISSESVDKPISSVEAILEPIFCDSTANGEAAKVRLPFVCAKYRTNVRVVDFRPNHLWDFACARRQVEFDCLSDYSGDRSPDSESEDDGRVVSGDVVWEWRFALELEDASVKSKSRAWVLVDNAEAQYLTGLDASNLREDHENLALLRERLSALWGDLEESKAPRAAEQDATSRQRPGDLPPPTASSDGDGDGARSKADEAGRPAVSNRPFTCCIKQYGVRVREDDPALADAGDGMRWERVFGLFGTKICS